MIDAVKSFLGSGPETETELEEFGRTLEPHPGLEGDYKRGYVDEDEEYAVFTPKKGRTFGQKRRRVETWKQNAERLSEVDMVDEAVRESRSWFGRTLEQSPIPSPDYETIRRNEQLLHEVAGGGVTVPDDSPEVVKVNSELSDRALPALVEDYRPEMVTDLDEIDEPDRKLKAERKMEVLGAYLDFLVLQGVYSGRMGDFGPERNLYYDPTTDEVGVYDLGEV